MIFENPKELHTMDNVSEKTTEAVQDAYARQPWVKPTLERLPLNEALSFGGAPGDAGNGGAS